MAGGVGKAVGKRGGAGGWQGWGGVGWGGRQRHSHATPKVYAQGREQRRQKKMNRREGDVRQEAGEVVTSAPCLLLSAPLTTSQGAKHLFLSVSSHPVLSQVPVPRLTERERERFSAAMGGTCTSLPHHQRAGVRE